MGKQGSPRSPRPEAKNEDGNYDPPIGRRPLVGDSYYYLNSKPASFHGFKKNDISSKYGALKGNHVSRKNVWLRKHLKPIALTFLLMGFLFLLDSLMVSIFDPVYLRRTSSENKVQK